VVRAARRVGLRDEDLLLWHTGGVLSMFEPYLNQRLWPTWRTVAVHQIGMRRAALACAAKVSPKEAVDMVAAGTFSADGLRMLAALNANTF